MDAFSIIVTAVVTGAVMALKPVTEQAIEKGKVKAASQVFYRLSWYYVEELG